MNSLHKIIDRLEFPISRHFLPITAYIGIIYPIEILRFFLLSYLQLNI
jgi:hypothetical protein